MFGFIKKKLKQDLPVWCSISHEETPYPQSAVVVNGDTTTCFTTCQQSVNGLTAILPANSSGG